VTTRPAREVIQLPGQVRLDVLPAGGQAGQLEMPEVDAREQVLPEPALLHALTKIRVGTCDELELGPHLAIGAHREEPLLLDRAQQHGLLVGSELRDLVEEQQPPVGPAQQARTVGHRPGERALHMPEQGRHRLVSAERRAVDLHHRPREQPALPLQLVDPTREPGLAGAGRSAEQQRGLGAEGDPLDLVDQLVECWVTRVDARFQEGRGLRLDGRVPAGDRRVAVELEVDDRPMADLLASARRRGLKQSTGKEARFGEQEQADLRDVRAGGDVHQQLVVLCAVGERTRRIVQGGVHLLEVPGVVDLERHHHDLGLGRQTPDVFDRDLGLGPEFLWNQQLQPIDAQVRLLEQRDRGPPALPSSGADAAIELRTPDPEHHAPHRRTPDGDRRHVDRSPQVGEPSRLPLRHRGCTEVSQRTPSRGREPLLGALADSWVKPPCLSGSRLNALT
jgi:hypothetical protein